MLDIHSSWFDSTIQRIYLRLGTEEIPAWLPDISQSRPDSLLLQNYRCLSLECMSVENDENTGVSYF